MMFNGRRKSSQGGSVKDWFMEWMSGNEGGCREEEMMEE